MLLMIIVFDRLLDQRVDGISSGTTTYTYAKWYGRDIHIFFYGTIHDFNPVILKATSSNRSARN